MKALETVGLLLMANPQCGWDSRSQHADMDRFVDQVAARFVDLSINLPEFDAVVGHLNGLAERVL